MSDTLGDRLRRQREHRNIALTAIAEETKINVSLLKALELDDVSRWPTGIFRRAFVRAYARAIGLDGEAVLQEFLAAHPDPVLQDGAATTLDAGQMEKPNGHLELGRLAPAHQPAMPPPRVDVDLLAAADICTRMAQVQRVEHLRPLLGEMITLVGARGIMVWTWRSDAARLVATVTAGYDGDVVRRLPGIGRDSDNATAAAFRSGRMTIVPGRDSCHGAIAVPATGPYGVVAVLAIELPGERERQVSIQAVALIWAAQISGILSNEVVEDQRTQVCG